MKLEFINPTALKDALQERSLHDGLFRWLSSKDFMIKASRTELKNIKEHVNDNWPQCCPFHKHLETNTEDYFKKFPNCCETHTKLHTAPWFNKSDFETLPEKILETARHTENIIAEKIEDSDWFEHISEFIEYAIESFGQLPEGYGGPVGLPVYTSYVKAVLSNMREQYPTKSTQLLSYLSSFESVAGIVNMTDVNELIRKYQRWLEIFPWNISYLSHLKNEFKNQLPIINGQPTYNRYSGISKAKVITMERMVTFLVDTTTSILKEVNVKVLLDRKILTEPDKKQIELINARRDHELKLLGQDLTDERKVYSNILEQWFQGEITYLKDMGPFLIKLESKPSINSSLVGKAEIKPDISKLFNKFCNKMPIDVAVSHFSILTTTQSQKGSSFLTTNQLNIFIARAFGGQLHLPKQVINYGHGETRLIVSLFASFFQIASRQYEPSAQCKLKYIKLLADHFEGWDEKKLKSNFKVITGAWKK